MPSRLRALRLVFHVAALVIGLWIGMLTYDAWGGGDDPAGETLD